MQLPPWHAEIVELHDFFQGWLGGNLPNTDAVFARFLDVNDPAFTLIGPHGTLMTYSALVDWIRSAYATRPNWRMWIENVQLVASGGDLTIATYEEWQETPDGVTTRLSTVVFRHDPHAPNRLRWVHVHETWVPKP
ncbi:MAG: hypothetical protein Fur005_36360 [Roseiflexaceae bacterium]